MTIFTLVISASGVVAINIGLAKPRLIVGGCFDVRWMIVAFIIIIFIDGQPNLGCRKSLLLTKILDNSALSG